MIFASLFRLIALSAIWGGSFLLIRIGAPVLGPVALMEARVVLAAMFLAAVAVVLYRPLAWRTHWRHCLIIGLLNSALPFLLFGYAALTLSAMQRAHVRHLLCPLGSAGSRMGKSVFDGATHGMEVLSHDVNGVFQ